MRYRYPRNAQTSTYDHRVWKTGLPVRSAVLKPHAGELVVGWVTTSESSLLYVFESIFEGLVPSFSMGRKLSCHFFFRSLRQFSMPVSLNNESSKPIGRY
jgi:hypothetical protein